MHQTLLISTNQEGNKVGLQRESEATKVALKNTVLEIHSEVHKITMVNTDSIFLVFLF